MLRLAALVLCLLTPLAASAQPTPAEDVVLGLSQKRVRINANFDGSEILLFGAIKRDAPQPDSALDVIITIAGPSEPVVVRRKEKRYGIWINTESVEVAAAPSFYAVSSSAPLPEILSETANAIHRITADRAVWTLKSEATYAAAIQRIRSENGLYQLNEGAVEVAEQTLFRSTVQMPANLTEGPYIARVYLLRGQQVISRHETVIDVRKVGLERFLFNLSRDQSLIYGLLSLAIAIAAGWGASAAFRILKRG